MRRGWGYAAECRVSRDVWSGVMDESGERPRAVVIGAGIGGLASAVALCAAGWDVTVCERAPVVEPVGSRLALAPNGLRALDAIGQDCQGLIRLGLGGPGLAGSELRPPEAHAGHRAVVPPCRRHDHLDLPGRS